MARFAIICEYNPLHTGHAYHLQSARDAGADEIVCIMSGNYTQRGEPAVAHKYARAAAAIGAGADLVVELPFPYASASAEFFACAGVAAADALGADALYFGSECGDIDRLRDMAKATLSSAFKQTFDALVKTNIGTAAAYAQALEMTAHQEFPTLSNDILGLAYCKAILRGTYEIEPLCTKRLGAGYNEHDLTDAYPSATALRQLMRKQGMDALQPYLPSASYEALCKTEQASELLDNTGAFDAAVLALLRLMPAEQIENAALCAGGLGARIAQKAHDASSLLELHALCAHKSLPDAHIRRAVLYAVLGVSEHDLRRAPSYLSVLAANERGCKILAQLRHTCPVPLVVKPADAPDCRQRELCDRADALYTLALKTPQGSGFFKRFSPYIHRLN